MRRVEYTCVAMFFRKRHPCEPVGGTETPENVALGRRRLLMAGAAGAGMVAAGGYLGWRWFRGSDQEVIERGAPLPQANEKLARFFPVQRDARFDYGRAETLESDAARYTNFYEFSRFKWSWRLVDGFQTDPWKITVDGLCRRPFKLDIDQFLSRYADELVERQYRHRCVETWAMAIPWSGVPLARVLQDADPLAQATHVRFVSFNRPGEAPGIQELADAPWPYVEGLTLPEAVNDLTLLAVGMYGHPLLKQHGAPIRLVVPWKYGFKSIKSIERIELVGSEPATFWSTLNPQAYPFQANVEPDVPRPWPQATERMLGSGDEFPTRLYNGYEEAVGGLYRQHG